MSNVQTLLSFALWTGYTSAEDMVSAYNASQGEAFDLSVNDRATIDRAIKSVGLSYPIDLERQGAGVRTAAVLYRNTFTEAIVDGSTLGGADMSHWDEMIASEDTWFTRSFVRSSMDPDILADLLLTPWPSELLLLRMYRLMHRIKFGVELNLTALQAQAQADAFAAREAAYALELEHAASVEAQDAADAQNADAGDQVGK